MNLVVGIVILVVAGILFAGQTVSVVNLGLAQRLGLQEPPDQVDPLFTRLEVWTARWDLLSLWTPIVAGILMVLDHSWWPYAAMIGGAVWFDTGGREAAKVLGLEEQRVRTGAPAVRRVLFGTYMLMLVLGVLTVGIGLAEAV